MPKHGGREEDNYASIKRKQRNSEYMGEKIFTLNIFSLSVDPKKFVSMCFRTKILQVEGELPY